MVASPILPQGPGLSLLFRAPVPHRACLQACPGEAKGEVQLGNPTSILSRDVTREATRTCTEPPFSLGCCDMNHEGLSKGM